MVDSMQMLFGSPIRQKHQAQEGIRHKGKTLFPGSQQDSSLIVNMANFVEGLQKRPNRKACRG